MQSHSYKECPETDNEYPENERKYPEYVYLYPENISAPERNCQSGRAGRIMEIQVSPRFN